MECFVEHLCAQISKICNFRGRDPTSSLFPSLKCVGQKGIFIVMVREKDVCWEYADKLDGNKVRCKFCSRILNGGISRLKHHLSRIPSKGVNPCSKVRDDVTDKVRAIIASKDDGKETSTAKKQKPVEAKSPVNSSASKVLISMDAPSPIAKIFSPLTMVASSPGNDQENAERCIALFFFENELDISVARSLSYQLMIDAVGKCGTGFRGPSAETLKTMWVERIKSEVSLQSKGIEKEWATTGCTIIAETWTDNKSKALINFLVSSPSRTFFHKSVDVTSHHKNITFYPDLFDSLLQDFGPENVVQIIVDKNLNCNGLANHLLQNYGTIFMSPCASQCLNAILEEFSKVDWVNRCMVQAQAISKFVYNNSGVLDLMKKFIGGQEIIKTGITKPVSNFLSLQSILKQRSRLKHMFNSPEFSSNPVYANKSQSITCIAILDDAAAFLNPSIQYNPEIKFLRSIKEDFLRVLEKLLPTPELRRDITNQILLFTRATGMFGCNLAKEAIDTVSPGLWWEQYGDSAPTLQRVAIRILSQVCSIPTVKKQWNTFQQIHSEKRNKIDKETLSDLAYINYNLKLSRSTKSKSPESDPLQLDDIDMTSEWVEEAESSSPTQWLDRFGSALDGSDLNTRQFSAAIFGASADLFGL
ncbi:hypothetical protein Vadar_021786 [Vaccinium darrowii]|uniref:Uncharacterized protein n=1 Tax=Vaccinium darrowii TaxID=229202 RepID=A0ACB7YQN3_9ERIC|nr:hypothetical protein Vadar_021786 [Vaccinium darrowii]